MCSLRDGNGFTPGEKAVKSHRHIKGKQHSIYLSFETEKAR